MATALEFYTVLKIFLNISLRKHKLLLVTVINRLIFEIKSFTTYRVTPQDGPKNGTKLMAP